MKIGTIRAVCSFARNASLIAFFLIFGLRCYNSMLAANEVTASERMNSDHIRIPTTLSYAEAARYEYTVRERDASTPRTLSQFSRKMCFL